MRVATGAVAVLWLALLESPLINVSGFIVGDHCRLQRRSTFGLLTNKATVYFGDGEASSWNPSVDDDDFVDPFAADSHESNNGISVRVQEFFRDHVATLARMAAAFAPSDQKLNIEDIEHVEVLELDDHHIDVEAVVCEDDGCVSLKVPVSFPAPCASDDPDQCVLDNIAMLDHQAQDRLRELEQDAAKRGDDLSSHSHVVTLDNEILPPLEAPILPSWWIQPSWDMADQCQDLIQLLNRPEYAPDIAALASRVVENVVVERATVTAVGPAGIHFYLTCTPIVEKAKEEEVLLETVQQEEGGNEVLLESIEQQALDALEEQHHDAEDLLKEPTEENESKAEVLSENLEQAAWDAFEEHGRDIDFLGEEAKEEEGVPEEPTAVNIEQEAWDAFGEQLDISTVEEHPQAEEGEDLLESFEQDVFDSKDKDVVLQRFEGEATFAFEQQYHDMDGLQNAVVNAITEAVESTQEP